jgi:hypothetical protein
MSLAALNSVRVLTSTTGQGTMTLGAAYSSKFLTEVQAGAVDATPYRYRIDDGNDFEIGYGTYTLSGRTLTRAVEVSCIGGTEGTTKLTLSGAAQVRFIVSAADYATFLRAADIGGSVQGYDANTAKLNVKQAFTKSQRPTPVALTHNTAWDGDVAQDLTVAVNGSNFTIANPSPVPSAGTPVSITVVWSSAHTISFGNLFKGITGITWPSTSGKEANITFRSDGTYLKKTGYDPDIAN